MSATCLVVIKVLDDVANLYCRRDGGLELFNGKLRGVMVVSLCQCCNPQQVPQSDDEQIRLDLRVCDRLRFGHPVSLTLYSEHPGQEMRHGVAHNMLDVADGDSVLEDRGVNVHTGRTNYETLWRSGCPRALASVFSGDGLVCSQREFTCVHALGRIDVDGIDSREPCRRCEYFGNGYGRMTIPAMTMSGRLVVASTLGEDDHDTGGWHPERPARLGAVEAGLAESSIHIHRLASRSATSAELERVHSPAYLSRLERFLADGGGELDPDTPTSRGSWGTALRAAGAALEAVDALRRGEGTAAFVACRPPGHHATAGRAMGFCLLNNVGIAAAALADAGERVFILDWDVHHGNGTQDIFWDDPRVLFASLHEWPTYPGTGRASEIGGGAARGLTVNVPLPAGATGDVALRALDELVAPAVDAFDPTWVLISAGYDAHRADPIGGLALSAGDFAALTTRACAFAPSPGRVVAVLEGGYDLDGLRRSVTATASNLVGVHVATEPATSGGPGFEAVDAAAAGRLLAEAESP